MKKGRLGHTLDYALLTVVVSEVKNEYGGKGIVCKRIKDRMVGSEGDLFYAMFIV